MTQTRSQRARRYALVGGGALGLAIVVLVLISTHVARSGSRSMRAAVDELAHAPVAIVLGAGMRADGTPSDALADRLAQAVELYATGKADKLLLSGDHGSHDYDEVNGMRRWVLERGVAPKDVFCDHAGFSTWETFARARAVFGVERAIVVTQRFHLPRALFTARANGIAAEGAPCDARTYVHATRYELREFGSRCKAWLQARGLGAHARVGPPIPLAGDGRVSWDRFD